MMPVREALYIWIKDKEHQKEILEKELEVIKSNIKLIDVEIEILNCAFETPLNNIDEDTRNEIIQALRQIELPKL